MDRVAASWTPECPGFDARAVKRETSVPIRSIILLVFLKVEMAHFKLVIIAKA